MMYAGLGMIPAWQFSTDPAINFKINPNVVYPDGVYQTTTQPIGPWFNPSPPSTGVSGLGTFDFSTLGGAVSTIGSLLLLGLAGFGGYSLYKKFKKK